MSRKGELKNKIWAYIAAALIPLFLVVQAAQSYRYRDSIYPEIKARTYIYNDISGESAAFILRQDKEEK